MSNTKIVRNELSKYAQQIETLAREVQTKLSQGGDPLTVANELVRNSSTFIFVLGEMYALEQRGTRTKVKATKVKSAATIQQKYHNVRDSLGRFSRV